ncbi:hypothetical protein RJT34_09360 [Clitoria ternatea]|uniref:Uncharacterized protein n=1 Tax=Clitoria ternatea TaxID=43366 RepID=A0AAN9K5K4_CLITE
MHAASFSFLNKLDKEEAVVKETSEEDLEESPNMTIRSMEEEDEEEEEEEEKDDDNDDDDDDGPDFTP